jgi:hypothetical protein
MIKFLLRAKIIVFLHSQLSGGNFFDKLLGFACNERIAILEEEAIAKLSKHQ